MLKPRITTSEARAALTAYKQHGAYEPAAAALGITTGSFQRRFLKARAMGITAGDKPRRTVYADFCRTPDERPQQVYSPVPAPTPVSDEVIRVLAIGDTHDDPYLPKDRFRWIGRHAAEMQPDRIVQIGDICDLESLSFHSPNDSESGRYKPRYLCDMDSLDQALDALMEPIGQANLDVPFDITLGNHENRIWRFEDATPETSGMLQMEFGAKLHRYGIQFHRYGQFLMIGGVGFTHAPFSVMGKPIGGMTASQTVGRQAMFDIVSGHTHKGNAITVPKVGDDQKVTVIDLGCALPHGHIQGYAKHTTTGWFWGVWELEIVNGHIESYSAISMRQLQRRYG